MELDISTCTFSEYDTEGFLGIQVGPLAEGSHGITPSHHLAPLGLDVRPVDPLQNGELGALALRIPDGAHREFALVLNDLRTEPALPNLAKGATRLFDSGTYKGHPFHFTVTLDPLAEKLESKSHRVGGKWRYVNAEGLEIEYSGTEVSISHATAVKCGGEEQLAKFTSLSNALAQMQAAITAIAGAAPLAAAALSVPTAAAAQAVAAFSSTGATLITKGA